MFGGVLPAELVGPVRACRRPIQKECEKKRIFVGALARARARNTNPTERGARAGPRHVRTVAVDAREFLPEGKVRRVRFVRRACDLEDDTRRRKESVFFHPRKCPFSQNESKRTRRRLARGLEEGVLAADAGAHHVGGACVCFDRFSLSLSLSLSSFEGERERERTHSASSRPRNWRRRLVRFVERTRRRAEGDRPAPQLTGIDLHFPFSTT